MASFLPRRPSVDSLLLILLLLLLASAPLAVLAYDPSERSCVGDNVCLTSFHWCANQDLRADGQTGCSFPDGAYPLTLEETQQNAALLSQNREYVISWKKGDPTNERPVRITWRFGGGDGADGVNTTWGPKWQTSEFPTGCAMLWPMHRR